jgi:hypothetical protein
LFAFAYALLFIFKVIFFALSQQHAGIVLVKCIIESRTWVASLGDDFASSLPCLQPPAAVAFRYGFQADNDIARA